MQWYMIYSVSLVLTALWLYTVMGFTLLEMNIRNYAFVYEEVLHLMHTFTNVMQTIYSMIILCWNKLVNVYTWGYYDSGFKTFPSAKSCAEVVSHAIWALFINNCLL